MTHPDHLADEVLSALVDDQFDLLRTPEEVSLAQAQAHLATCAVCQARLAELRTLVGLLQALPVLEPPRDFQLGPRLVADPPNVVRLRRWYAWTRVGAAALAAAFVFLSAGTLYVDSQSTGSSVRLSSSSKAEQPVSAIAPAPQSAPARAGQGAAGVAPEAPGAPANDAVPTSAPPPPAARAAAPAAAPPAAVAAVRSQTVPTPPSAEPGDQIAAATSAGPLPTPQPPTPTALPRSPSAFASAPVTPQQADPAAPIRIAAALVGVLAAFGIVVVLLIRHRLRTASPSHLE